MRRSSKDLARVEWTEDALEDLEKLDRFIQRRVLKKVSWVSRHFENLVPEPLAGELSGTYKIRVGDWRVIYSIEKYALVIHAVGHRKDIYTH